MSFAGVPAPPAGPPGGISRGWWLPAALAAQRRVIGALVLREMQTRFGRHNMGFLWLFFEPLFLGLMVAVIHMAHGQHLPGGINPFLFSIVGYVPFFMFRAIVNRATSALHANLTLLFHRQVTPFDVIMARNILEAASVLGVIIMIVGVTAAFFEIVPDNMGLILLSMGLSFFLSHGLSMMLAAASARWDGVERLVHPVTYLMMPLSGAFYALAWLPARFREILLWNPLVHVHEAIREGMFGDRLVSYFDLGYVTWCTLVVNLLGLAALRGARRKLDIF
ncbi:ABC transporter permease [Muricoccus radiodurans]|uniref:ABC transporter permease n=1 Tax=Muricoccus radiodurans TaxID=2231721 RepID=UPI003CE8523D